MNILLNCNIIQIIWDKMIEKKGQSVLPTLQKLDVGLIPSTLHERI